MATQMNANKQPSMGRCQNPFIVATDKSSIKPDKKSRQLIRCHVMQGKKNRKRVESIPKSWINSQHHSSRRELSEQARLQRAENSIGPWLTLSPSLMGFDPSIEPYMLQDIHKFITFMRNAMFPNGSLVDIQEDDRHWFEDLARDTAYSQTVWQCAQAHFDIMKSQTGDLTAIFQTNKAIAMLRQRLADTDMFISDSTLFTVLSLAMISEVFHDLETSKKHLHGLYQLLKQRGGINTLANTRSLQVKCCRFDLRFALKTGSKTLFFADDNSLSWESYFPRAQKLRTTAHLHPMYNVLDDRFLKVWLDLRELATAVDLAYQTDRKLSPVLYQEGLLSVMYRLEMLESDNNEQQEMLRIAMLVYSSTTFFQTDFTLICHQDLVKKLGRIFRSASSCADQGTLELNLWCVFVAGLPGLDALECRPWMFDYMLQISRALGLRSWFEIKQNLKSFIWVNIINDKIGERLLNEALKFDSSQERSPRSREALS